MGRPQIKYENITEGSISTVEAVKGVGLSLALIKITKSPYPLDRTQS